MTSLSNPQSARATRLLLLGAGELGKEVAIEAQRLGLFVIAVDRYADAPAMQIAHRSHVVSMLDAKALREIIEKEKPNYIVPEIEAIATDLLVELEAEGYCVIPTAKATQLTMNREGIRRLAAEELHLLTSPYQFVNNKAAYLLAVQQIGLPCVVKPVMSSSGKGQTIIKTASDIDKAWEIAQTGGRTKTETVMVEGFIPFDDEITLLTVRHRDGTTFCEPIGHRQVNGDYHESWQPHPMSATTLQRAQTMAETVTNALGGYGVFGVEFFIQGENVYFSEISPRPHDTGLVTLLSQDLSEFALHVRAILGLPIPLIRHISPAATYTLLANGQGETITCHHLDKALAQADTHVRLFGKPEVRGERRIGVLLCAAASVTAARAKTKAALNQITIEVTT